MNNERFYAKHSEMAEKFSDEHFIQEAGAWLAGFDMGLVLKKNNSLNKLIREILDKEINNISGKISRYFNNKEYFDDTETIKKFLNLIIDGINHART